MFSSQNSQVSSAANYIEDVFQTWLYTGNGSTQTITNGIDLSTKGGLVWIKERTRSGTEHSLFDTVRGRGSWLSSALTDAAASVPSDKAITSFNSDGFSLGGSYYGTENSNGQAIASWTFRKQPKFFDVVTFTTASDGSATVSHNLGSTPGCVITKCTGTTSAWSTWHRSLSGTNYEVRLNSTAAETNIGTWINPSSTQVQFIAGNLIGSQTYVAYLFAHNAGGFGLTGTDNVISCGSFTTDGSGNATVDLGYEPQWVLLKDSTNAANWAIVDVMRSGLVNQSSTSSKALFPNLSNAESNLAVLGATATGFSSLGVGTLDTSSTYIYIAIRRGPMKVPTSGTSVFSPLLTSTTSGATNTTGFPVDSQFLAARGGSVYNSIVSDRLRGVSSNSTETGRFLVTSATSAENTSELVTEGWNNTAFLTPSVFAGVSYITWNFGRAPSFFDEVCYTGNRASGASTTQTLTHNLGAIPELMIVKGRSNADGWQVYSSTLGAASQLSLSSTAAAFSAANPNGMWNETAPTATQFTVGANNNVNRSGSTYVAYLFATCAGVSKVGTFTGNGSSQTINCGFTGGARFVMIKATSTTGYWVVADSARGIVSGNDPYIELNTTNAEDTGEDWLDTDSTGFIVNEVSGSNANTNGVTYIYLAIA